MLKLYSNGYACPAPCSQLSGFSLTGTLTLAVKPSTKYQRMCVRELASITCTCVCVCVCVQCSRAKHGAIGFGLMSNLAVSSITRVEIRILPRSTSLLGMAGRECQPLCLCTCLCVWQLYRSALCQSHSGNNQWGQWQAVLNKVLALLMY